MGSRLTKAQSREPKPRGARFHALRLAKWMLSVMRFLCKFSAEKIARNTGTHTD